MPLCELCQVDVPRGSEEAHITGKKHVRALNLYQTNVEQADRSVYVRGFSRGTPDLALVDYFQQFGPVSDVFVDKKQGGFAFVEFSTKESRNRLLSIKNQKLPLFYGTKLSVQPKHTSFNPIKRRQQQQQQQQTSEHSDGASTSETAGIICLQELKAKLMACTDVTCQLHMLMTTVQLSGDDVKLRSIVCSALQDTLQALFPGCSVHQFGSSANGFGVKGCDMDIFLDLDPDRIPGNRIVPSAYLKKVPALSSVEGVVTTGDLLSLSPFNKLKAVSCVMSKTLNDVSKLFVIPSERCPVLRFVYSACGLNCDLSCNNRLGYWNTRLLRVFTRYDLRVQPLIYAIRHWAKAVGQDKKGLRLSNYALSLMCMFYLQNCTLPVLPSLEELRKYCDASDERLIDGWNCSFPSSLDKVPPSKNTDSTGELLKGFFKFYATFDFRHLAVCILTGQTTSTANLARHQSAFAVGPLNVQDPFVLSHNTTSNINEKMACAITCAMTSAHQLCSQKNFNIPSEQSWGLVALLEEPDPTAAAEQMYKSRPPLPSDNHQYILSVHMKSDVLYQDSYKNLDGADIKEHWCEKAAHFLQECFEEVMCFVMEDVHVPQPNVLKRQNSGSYCPTANKCQKTHHKAAGSYDLHNVKVTDGSSVNEYSLPSSPDSSHPVAPCTSILVDCVPGCATEVVTSQSGKPLEDNHVNTDKTSDKKCSDDTEHKSFTTKDVDNDVGELKPSKFSVEDANPVLVKNLNCCAMKRTWVGRKNVQQALPPELKNCGTLSLQKEISKRIISPGGSHIDCCVKFQMQMFKVISKDDALIELKFQPITAQKEFTCMFPFLRSFMPKLVDQYLTV